MNDKFRYSMQIGNMGQNEMDLLECLLRIDAEKVLDARAGELRQRLLEAGLADQTGNKLRLTPAGIERCRSLQHRAAGDKEAAKILADRGITLAGMEGAEA